MPQFTYIVDGRDGDGHPYTVGGNIAIEHEGHFALALTEALRESFMQVTQGKAVYGHPGTTCRGPYTILRVVVARKEP